MTQGTATRIRPRPQRVREAADPAVAGTKKPRRSAGFAAMRRWWLWVDSIMRARHLKYLKERYWTSMFIQKLH